MSASLEKTAILDLSNLATFERNKPYDEELFGRLPNTLDDGYTYMQLINTSWQNILARNIELSTVDAGGGEEILDNDQIIKLLSLAEQVRCVAALAEIVKKGPDSLSGKMGLNINTGLISSLVRSDLCFYLTARAQGQANKDPRYVAKIEDVVATHHSYIDKTVTFDVIVSDIDGNSGHFPSNTSHWQLAHLATRDMTTTREFPYISNGYR